MVLDSVATQVSNILVTSSKAFEFPSVLSPPSLSLSSTNASDVNSMITNIIKNTISNNNNNNNNNNNSNKTLTALYNLSKLQQSYLNNTSKTIKMSNNNSTNNGNNGNNTNIGQSVPTPNGSNVPPGNNKSKSENPFAKLLISGGVTIFFEAFAFGHYLEMIKILKQTTGDPYAVITKRMIASKGFVGILDGFMPWGALQACVKGSSFGFGQAAALKMLELIPNDVINMSDSMRMILSGGFGGFTQGVIMSPMLLLKTRVMTDPRFRTTGGFWSTSLHSLKLGKELIATEGGLKSLTKGMGIFSGKRFADWTTRYGFVVGVEYMVKQQTGKKKLSKPEQAMCALAGGTLSALVTVPIDVMVATVQQANKKGQHVSVIQIYKDAIKQGGVGGMVKLSTRGLVARVSHVAMTVLMMKTVSSWIYNVMFRN